MPQFPRLAAYLDDLPAGLASYRACKSKASLLVFTLRRLPFPPALLCELPPELRPLLSGPLMPNAWIPSTEYFAAVLATMDAGKLTDDEICTSWYRVMQDINESKLYSLLLKLLTPSQLMVGTGSRWNTFHQGTRLVSRAVDRDLLFELRGPRGLIPPALRRALRDVFQAVIDVSMSKGRVFEIVSLGAETSSYVLRA